MEGMRTPTLGPGHTRADLDRMPDDGNRYELLEGELVVSPSPRPLHQIISMELAVLLHGRCPNDLLVLAAPLDVELDPSSILIPDIVVVAQDQLDERGVVGAPLLAVEILSPGTRGRDLVRKKRLYERAGVAAYWIVDAEDDAVSVTAWELRDGGYEVVAAIAGDEEWIAEVPFEVAVVPSRLLR